MLKLINFPNLGYSRPLLHIFLRVSLKETMAGRFRVDDSACLSFSKSQFISSIPFPCDSAHIHGKPSPLSDLSDTLTFSYCIYVYSCHLYAVIPISSFNGWFSWFHVKPISLSHLESAQGQGPCCWPFLCPMQCSVFHAKMGIKDRNVMDLTEAEDIKKKWQEYIEQH